jgi:ubiquinol-cytochrome c reductase cytochrome b subunit
LANSVREWFVDRFALRAIYENFLNRRVPRAPWYSGDGATLLLLVGVQVLTGAMLAFSYSASPDAAYQSVVYITEEQVMGWFLRGLHYWSAGMIMIMLVYHVARQILLGGYKAPREGTWIIGVLLLYCMLLMAYTGYLLRWDERAVYGFRVMLHMIIRVPVIGEPLALVFQGGPDLGPRTLSQLYAVHVLWVPILILGLAAYHVYLVVQRGTITAAERQQPVASANEQKRLYKEESNSSHGGEDFYPVTTFKAGVMGGVVFTIALALTIFLGPGRLYPEANLVEPSMPAEEWWFWWYSGLIALLPPWIAPWFVVLFPLATFAILISLPFLDRGPRRGLRARPLWAILVVLLIVALLALSDYRRRSPFIGWPDPAPPPVPEGLELTPAAERGRLLFAEYGCNSCHAVAGRGRQVGPDFTKLPSPRSHDELRKFILQPPDDAPMPAYRGRLTGDDLRAVVEFCHVAQTFPRRP